MERYEVTAQDVAEIKANIERRRREAAEAKREAARPKLPEVSVEVAEQLTRQSMEALARRHQEEIAEHKRSITM